jgi:potassium channel
MNVTVVRERLGGGMDGEIAAEYELNNEIVDDTLHGSVGSRLSLLARELKSQGSSALRLPIINWCYSFVIHPNGR